MNLGTSRLNGGCAKRPVIFGFVKAGYLTAITIVTADCVDGLLANP
jgi:hypothetical protein